MSGSRDDTGSSAPSERGRSETENEKLGPEQEPKPPSHRRESAAKQFALWRSPLTLALVGGIVTLLANILTTYLTGQNEVRVEREKFQSELIKQFLEPASVETRQANLKFLAESGLIPEFGQSIASYLKSNPNSIPQTVSSVEQLPAAGADNRVDETLLDRLVMARNATFTIENSDDPRFPSLCSGFLIAPSQIVTAVDCLPAGIATDAGALTRLKIIGTAADKDARPAIASVAIKGSDKDTSIALISLAQPFAGAQPLPIAGGPPTMSDHVMLVYSSEPGKFLAAFGDNCQIELIQERRVGYRCDVSAGSRGAPVFSMSSGSIIAVHSAIDPKFRYGVRLDGMGLANP